MAKTSMKLKPVESTLEAQLEAAIAEEVALREQLQKSEGKFKATYPGDLRLLLDPVVSFEPAPPKVFEATNELRDEQRQQGRAKFLEEWEELRTLGRRLDDASRLVGRLRTTIDEHVDADAARAELATVLNERRSADRQLAQLSKSVLVFGGMVERARAGVMSAEAKLTEAAATVDQAMNTGLSDFLRIDGSTPGPEVHRALNAARAGKLAAADDLEMARKALAIAEGRLAEEEAKVRNATAELANLAASAGELARSIAATAIPGLIEEAKAMTLELEGRRQVLSFLSDFASTEHDLAVVRYLETPIFPFGVHGEQPHEHPAVAPWLGTIARLADGDAGAALPKG